MAPALTQIGPYRLSAKLGESDFAEVYRGEDTLFERVVDVKVLRPQAADDLALVRRFLASGREAMRLRHPNIVRVLDVGEADGRYYIATEPVIGKSLHDELARGKGPWSSERAIALARQVAAALDYAHGLGIVHLNLKPSNILLADDGRVLVIDFDGEAAPAWAGDPDHPLFSRLKSPAFLAPEQARGDEAVGPAADVYSLAALTYTLCAGRAPFAGRNPLGLLRQIAETPPPRVDQVLPAVDQRMADALARALAKEPDKRQSSPAAFVRSLVEGIAATDGEDETTAFADEPDDAAPVIATGALPAVSRAAAVLHAARRRLTAPSLPTPALALLALASLAALLMLIAAMRTAGTLMARLTDDPATTPGTVEIAQVLTTTTVALLPTVTQAAATATATDDRSDRAPAVAPSAAATVTRAPTPTRAVPAPRGQPGLMAVSRQVRMVEVVTSSPTGTPTASPTPTPPPTPSPSPSTTATATATDTPAPTSTPAPTATPAASLDDYSLIGRIAYAQWNPHNDRPDVYIWDTGLRASGDPLSSYRQPDFGPHGLLIANAEGAGRDNLVQMGWVGENAVIVSAHPEDAHPHWSPDGKRVVYDSAHMGDRQHRIYLQDDLTRRDDRPPLMYLAWELFGRYPVFLGNDQIAYNGCNYWASGSVCGIYVVDTAGDMPVNATGWPNDIPTDNLGARMLFMSDRAGNWDVFSANTDGSDLRQLTSEPGIDGLATASPDGRAIAFLTNRDGRWSLYVMRPDGQDATKLFDLPLGFGRGEYDWFQERLSWGY